jgi:hypothetical protein
MSMDPWVLAKLPKAGLANKLIVWGRACAFARQHQLPLKAGPWMDIKLKTYLAGGGTRLYRNYFIGNDERSWLQRWRRAQHIEEAALDVQLEPHRIYSFSQFPHWSDYYAGIRPQREAVRNSFFEKLHPARRQEIAALPSVACAMHVRLGDFNKLAAQQEFAQVGNTRTPHDWFISMIQGVRQVAGGQVPITLVSDGSNAELAPLLAQPGVTRGKEQSALLDMLLLAKAKILITSAGSSFGTWATFLGEGASINHARHFHAPARDAACNAQYFEGGVEEDVASWPALLCQQIQRSVR